MGGCNLFHQSEDWRKRLQPTIGGLGDNHTLLTHHQLQLIPVTSSPPSDLQRARQMAAGFGSTIVRRSAGQPLAAAYEARSVFITSLLEVLLLHMYKRTAKQVYQEWQQCEVITGKRQHRGQDRLRTLLWSRTTSHRQKRSSRGG